MWRFLIICVACVACNEPERAGIYPGELPDESPVKVKIVTASSKSLYRKISGEAIIEMTDERMIQSVVPGIVESVHVKAGDWVDQGDTLLAMVNEDEEIAWKLARIELNRCAYAYENMRMGFDALNDTIQNAIRYSSGLAAAEIMLRKAKMRLRQKIILAEQAGFIAGWNVRKGEFISPAIKLGIIYDPKSAIVKLPLLEVDLPLLQKGMRATGTTISGNQIEAVYSGLDPRIDDEGIFQTFWTITNRSVLFPGMHATMEVQTTMGRGVVLPASAIVERGGLPVVFVFENDTARWRDVRTGWVTADMIEISEGIMPGDTVIISNQFQIHDGVPVDFF